ncbi:MAG TPA: hypothetical protein VF177_20490 [Anaerolineae bacterium]
MRSTGKRLRTIVVATILTFVLTITRHFYLYYSVPDANGRPIRGRIVRYTEVDGVAIGETIIVDNLPARRDQLYHFGGALNFGPDGKL